MKRLALIVLGMLAAVAIAAAPIIPVALPQWFKSGFWVMPDSMSAVQNTAGTKITRKWALPRVDYDFPAIGPGGTGQAGGHLVSNAITATGARLGDNCSVESTGGDGGILPDLFLHCYVSAADTVKIRAESLLDDAGSLDPSDAGHYIFIESSQ